MIALHARAFAKGTICGTLAPTVPCSDYVATWPPLTPAYVYLVAARGDSVDGIAGLSCGISYDASASGLFVSWTNCTDGLTFPSSTPLWPGAGSGIRMTWTPTVGCQRTVRGSYGVHAIGGAFYIYSYGDPEEFSVIENQTVTTPELRVGDCSAAESPDLPLPRVGRVQFSSAPGTYPGYNPCTDCVPLVCSTASAAPQDATGPDSAEVVLTLTNCSSYEERMFGSFSVEGGGVQAFNVTVAPLDSEDVTIRIPCDFDTDPDTLTVVAAYTTAIGPGTSCSVAASETTEVICLPSLPEILSVADIGNDQGRQVRIMFNRSNLDRVGSPLPIQQYEIFRRIDLLPAPQMTPAAFQPKVRGRIARTPGAQSALFAGWELVGITPAHVESEYSLVVPTLADSTDDDGIVWSFFFVRAATSTPSTFFDSAPDSGYSVDNLAPSAPGGFTFLAPGVLNWEEAIEPDFDYFSVYGSFVSTFDGSAVLIGHTTGTSLDVQLSSYQYYHVTATDFAGNEGPASTTVNTVAVPLPGEVPSRFALWPNRPNPFAASTHIVFDLPLPDRVSIRIFDLRGSVVKTLLDTSLEPARYSIPWMGDDDQGQRVTAGMYFYHLETSVFKKTGKAIKAR